MKKTRTRHTAEFKTKVAIEAIKEQKTLADLSVMFGVTQQQISNWKNEFLRKSVEIFNKREPIKSWKRPMKSCLPKSVGLKWKTTG